MIRSSQIIDATIKQTGHNFNPCEPVINMSDVYTLASLSASRFCDFIVLKSISVDTFTISNSGVHIIDLSSTQGKILNVLLEPNTTYYLSYNTITSDISSVDKINKLFKVLTIENYIAKILITIEVDNNNSNLYHSDDSVNSLIFKIIGDII